MIIITINKVIWWSRVRLNYFIILWKDIIRILSWGFTSRSNSLLVRRWNFFFQINIRLFLFNNFSLRWKHLRSFSFLWFLNIWWWQSRLWMNRVSFWNWFLIRTILMSRNSRLWSLRNSMLRYFLIIRPVILIRLILTHINWLANYWSLLCLTAIINSLTTK